MAESKSNDSREAKPQLRDHINATDKLIDQVVYKLYNLNNDEIAIVKGKGAS